MIEREFKMYSEPQIKSLVGSISNLILNVFNAYIDGHTDVVKTLATDIVYMMDTARLVDDNSRKKAFVVKNSYFPLSSNPLTVCWTYERAIEILDDLGYTPEHDSITIEEIDID